MRRKRGEYVSEVMGLAERSGHTGICVHDIVNHLNWPYSKVNMSRANAIVKQLERSGGLIKTFDKLACSDCSTRHTRFVLNRKPDKSPKQNLPLPNELKHASPVEIPLTGIKLLSITLTSDKLVFNLKREVKEHG